MKNIKPFLAFLCLSLLPIVSFASIEVLGSLKHLHNGISGDTLRGEIKLHNSENTDQEVRIYQTDLLYNYEDYTFYDEPKTHERSNANWIQYSPRTAMVRANGNSFIQYEIVIPETDTLKGTYWSVLMVEGVNPINPEETGELNITTVTRYAIQMVTEIEEKGKGELTFLNPTLITEGEELFLAVDIVNTGQHYIAPEVLMELFDESGKSVKVISAPKKGLYPKTSARFRLNLEGVESRKTYQSLIIADGKEEDVFGIEYVLYF
jgi:hypothetical protein